MGVVAHVPPPRHKSLGQGSKSGLPGFTLQFVGQTSLASATPHPTLLINVLFNQTAIEWNGIKTQESFPP